MSDRNTNAKGRRKGSTFLMLRHDVLDSPAFLSLSSSAVKLLVDMGRQYDGRNNGNLTCTVSLMRKRGWHSSATIQRAKTELLQSGMIQKTRQGGMGIGPSLYALTWHGIDECTGKNGKSKHDAKPDVLASNLWRKPPDEK